LKPHRKYLTALLETSLSPLAAAGGDSPAPVAQTLRDEHMDLVVGLLRQRGLIEPSAVALQLYWTLYLGVLAFWAADRSPKQEDTLALLDQSMAMFAGWLNSAGRSD
jgi:hypothetical protein